MREELSRFSRRYRSPTILDEMGEQAEAHARELEELRRSYADRPGKGMAAWVRGETKRPPDEAIQTDRWLHNLNFRPCHWESGVGHVSCRLCGIFKDRHRKFAAQISGLGSIDEAVRQEAEDDLAAVVERALWLAD